MQPESLKCIGNPTKSLKKMNIINFNNAYFSLPTRLTFVFLLFALAGNAHSIETHPLDEIRELARKHVLAQAQRTNEDIQVEVGRLDPRLRLHQCTMPIEAYNQNYETRQGQSTIAIRCNDTKPWALYVPVSIKHFKMVATLKHAAIRNAVLTQDDIHFKKLNINRLSSGYFDDITQLNGKVLTQNLSRGVVLNKHHIKVPMAINRGQSVTLIAKNAVIEVRMKGTAMSKGAIGERIKVKNLKSQRIVEGVIIDDDLINVNL